MNKFLHQTFQTSLREAKNDEKKLTLNGVKSFVQIIFVLSFLMLIFLAFAKANGF